MTNAQIIKWINQTYDEGEVQRWKRIENGIVCYCLDGNVDRYTFDQMK